MKPGNTLIALMLTLLLLSSATCLSCRADDGGKQYVDITAEVDKDRIYIGDKIKLDIVVEPAQTEWVFPELPEKLGEFSVIESYPLKEGWPAQRITGQVFVLSIYTTGTHVIPPVSLEYRMPGESEWHTGNSPQVPIEVMSLLTGDDTDIRDLKGLIALGVNKLWIILISVAILAAAFLSWILWRRKTGRIFPKETKKESAYRTAYRQLDELKAMDLPGHGRIKEYYIRLSDIVRHYLEDTFSYRVPEMTTEEFLSTIKDSRAFKDEHRELLKEFLSNCDMVKFAKYGPTSLEVLDSFKAARHLVDETKHEEEAE
jgi:hypothetical protein